MSKHTEHFFKITPSNSSVIAQEAHSSPVFSFFDFPASIYLDLNDVMLCFEETFILDLIFVCDCSNCKVLTEYFFACIFENCELFDHLT